MRQAKAQWVGLFLAALVCWGPFGPGRADEPVPTTLKVTGGTGNWLVASNWSHGVPNSPGAIAIIGGSTNPPVHVTAPVTIGELRLLAPGTQFIGGIGPLTFDNPGDAPAVIRTIVPRNPAVTTSISTPIDIAAGETLLIDVTQPNSLHLQGSIIAATGTIEKHGDGPLVLSGSNSAWGGDLIIREGLVDVAYQDSLTNPMGQVVLEPGTTLRLQANMLTPLVIDGADLLVAGSRTLAGPIELRGTATLRGEGGASQPIRLTGPISGEGGWHIGDETQGLRNKTIELSGDNAYLGETVLGFDSDVTVRLLSPTGLGDTSAGTVVYEGPELLLDVVAQEPIVVRGGRVTWQGSSQAWATPVQMEGGSLRFNIPNATSDFDVSLNGGNNSILASGKWGGDIHGEGSLSLSGLNEFLGEIAHTGPLTISGASSVMTFNRVHSYDGQTTISSTDVVVNHAGAFGSSSNPLIIKSGFSSGSKQSVVTINETIERDIVLQGGVVGLVDTDDSYQGRLTLERGSVSLAGAPFAGELRLDNAGTDHLVSLSGGSHIGTITGHGRLAITGTIMDGSGDYRGFTRARAIVVNSAEALGSSLHGTLIWGGRQDFDVTQIMLPIEEPLAMDSDGVLSSMPNSGACLSSSRARNPKLRSKYALPASTTTVSRSAWVGSKPTLHLRWES